MCNDNNINIAAGTTYSFALQVCEGQTVILHPDYEVIIFLADERLNKHWQRLVSFQDVSPEGWVQIDLSKEETKALAGKTLHLSAECRNSAFDYKNDIVKMRCETTLTFVQHNIVYNG
ncbi:MAG: hypothetical protein MJY71_02405 [Bacteroidaceae bacterium]|nr:hypothetical protein [Bacteroidaceae bacterium]